MHWATCLTCHLQKAKKFVVIFIFHWKKRRRYVSRCIIIFRVAHFHRFSSFGVRVIVLQKVTFDGIYSRLIHAFFFVLFITDTSAPVLGAIEYTQVYSPYSRKSRIRPHRLLHMVSFNPRHCRHWSMWIWRPSYVEVEAPRRQYLFLIYVILSDLHRTISHDHLSLTYALWFRIAKTSTFILSPASMSTTRTEGHGWILCPWKNLMFGSLQQ